MIVFLTIVIAVLLGIIVYLNIEFYNEKKRFNLRVLAMRKTIADTTRKQSGQQGKLKLSEELNETLKSRQNTLNESIVKLTHALFEQVSKNKPNNS